MCGEEGIEVHLEYYKITGKWYGTGTYRTQKTNWHDIVREIQDMFAAEKRPGLVDGTNEFITVMKIQDTGLGLDIPHLFLPARGVR